MRPPAGVVVSIDTIKRLVAAEFGVTLLDMDSCRRHARVVLARQTAMYFARHMTWHSLSTIGRLFNRDHTTVMHAISKIDHLVDVDRELAGTVELLARALTIPRVPA